MQWISSKEHLPKKDQFIGCIREKYPSFCWIGKYKPPIDESDEFDYWIALPEIPVCLEYNGLVPYPGG